jgi:hypothetical protein
MATLNICTWASKLETFIMKKQCPLQLVECN